MNRLVRATTWLVGGVLLPTAVFPAAPAEPVDFSSQIRPIISARCFACHGPDEGSRKAKLRLDIREEAIAEKKGTRAIAPGAPAGSELIRRITTPDQDDVMPPAKEGHPLTTEQIELLSRWIQQGAPYSPHWAFTKPERAIPPPVRPGWNAENEIDAFVFEKLAPLQLQPSPKADRFALIRRVSLDLTGLPPTPAEVEAFVNDRRPDAYDRLVNRLLDSPAYGERWARVWLDLGRYADSAGYGSDPLRLNIWPWRDWVIQAINRNVPYDRFTADLIAGDLLPDATDDDRVATGFHRNTMTNTEGGTDDEEFRVAAVKDRANVTAQVWMGLTMGCAQCHSHKYDPITQREYYQFYAFFNQSEDNDQPDESPTLPLPTPEQRAKIDDLKSRISELEAGRVKITPEFEAEMTQWEAAAARSVQWIPLNPTAVKSLHGATLSPHPDQSVLAGGPSPTNDIYQIQLRTELTNLTALRLELLPDSSLPKGGPGRAADTGKAVLTEFQLAVRLPQSKLPRARFVRVELPGTQRVLSLAEVQVFTGSENVAPKGTATQSSVDSQADAGRAIDGVTDGSFDSASTTLTVAGDSPWWELDLGREVPLEEIVIWNRTDRGLGTRLNDFKVVALDGARSQVWEKHVGPAPSPAAWLRVPAEKTAKLQNASATDASGDFAAARAIDGKFEATNGWSFNTEMDWPHTITFEIEGTPIEESGALLIFTLTQKHGESATLGRFRLSGTTEPLPVRETPRNIREILEADPAGRSEEQRRILRDYFRDLAPSVAKMDSRLRQLRKDLDGIKPVSLPVMRELAADKQRATHLLSKGNFLAPGDPVTVGVPAAFPALPPDAPTNRLGLARWLTDRDNPLTARVAVNRLWSQLFGAGIVETEEDFGTQGSMPTHRELLDWLAVEFMDRSWDVKAILKTMVLSATYQQSSRVTPELLEKDPRNRLYARGSRLRLDAEMVRDQALALSGLLSRTIGGPSVYPEQPDGLWRAAFNGERTWATSQGANRHRRGLYTFWRRTVPYPSLNTFDAPSRETCTVRRIPTNTPLQAFVTLNDPVYVEASQALGRRLVKEGGNRVADRVRYGLALCLARPPEPGQVAALTELYEKELAHYREHGDDARKLATEPIGELPGGLEPAEAAAWTSVANVLLNLDGVLTKS